MIEFNRYSISLCLIVFVLLAFFFTLLISIIMRSTKKLIAYGEQDEEIIKEFTKKKKYGKSKAGKKFSGWNFLLSLLFLAVFGTAIFINVQEKSCSKTIPTPRVVQSASMSKKLEGNTYLTENHLNDQFNMYDIVLTYKLPAEMDLKLYDVVVYEVDGELIIHRIIQIEEPNEKHPDCRYFRLQGDNVDRPDVFPVKYEQMRGIYTGKRISYVGSFVMFLQSFAGWLCMGFLIVALLIMPVLDASLYKKRAQRFLFLQQQEEVQEVEQYPYYYWYGGYY